MAVTYNNTVKSNRMQMVLNAILNQVMGAATGTAAVSTLVIGTSALSGATGVLATLAMDTTPFSLDVATDPAQPRLALSDTPLSVSTTAAGTAAKAEIRNTGGTPVITGLTVGVGTGDIQLSTTTITFPGTVQITSGNIIHAA
jgi:hypothetical protein